MTTNEHIVHIRKQFSQLTNDLRADIEQIDDPKCRAMFETAAEVIVGLDTAFQHYEIGEEKAWK